MSIKVCLSLREQRTSLLVLSNHTKYSIKNEQRDSQKMKNSKPLFH